jgi:CHAP domain-containing protein
MSAYGPFELAPRSPQQPRRLQELRADAAVSVEADAVHLALRIAADRPAPHRHGGQRSGAVVCVLRLMGSRPGRHAAGRGGAGFGSVSALYDWAQRTGRATPAGTGVRPNPGDLIVWGGEHVGIVESVDAAGSIHTIEGNSSNAVSRRTYGPDGGGATGYVHIG